MKKITRNIFFISLITTLFIIFLFMFEINSVLSATLSLSTTSYPDYIAGYAIFGNAFMGTLGILESVLLVILLIPFILSTILHLISWLLHSKKDTPGNIIASIILAAFSSVIRIFLDILLIKIFFNTPFLLFICVIEIIGTLGIILYYIIKYKEISGLYSNLKNAAVNIF